MAGPSKRWLLLAATAALCVAAGGDSDGLGAAALPPPTLALPPPVPRVGAPADFASGTPLPRPLDAAVDGAWAFGAGAAGDAEWSLRLAAPGGALSLTLLFAALDLPPASELLIGGAASGRRQRVVPAEADGGRFMAAPVLGNEATLRYRGPAAAARPSIVIEGVLQGFRPLPFGGGARARAAAYSHVEAGAPAGGVAPAPEPEGGWLATVGRRAGRARPCLRNAACFPELADAANAVVLLIKADVLGAGVCTGTTVNNAAGRQLILTALHCMRADSADDVSRYWAALFRYEEPRCDDDAGGGGGGGGAAPAAALLRGLRVAWRDGAPLEPRRSDVLLLEIEPPVPPALRPYWLGWDAAPRAGAGAAPAPAACIHHAQGDAKQVALAGAPPRPVAWDHRGAALDEPGAPATHLQVTWAAGVTEAGSSGAALLDGASRAALGVLSGGTTPPGCAGGVDNFGALAAAWGSGLAEALGGGGPPSMPGRRGRPGPGGGPEHEVKAALQAGLG